jgi:ubiquinone/menaquinone biosynthesis C-methylase UbiE
VPNSAKFWDKTAEKYSKSPIKNMDAYNQTMDRAKAHLSNEDSVLEIGCGTGSTALLLADSVKHITASDISANMIEIAQSKANDQGIKNTSFVQADVFSDTLAPGSFDVITAFNVLHLVEDFPAVVRRINALLKPGGLLISKTPCLAAQTRLWSIPLYILGKLRVVPYVNCLQFDKLEVTISGGGFQLTEVGQYPASSMSRFLVATKV